MNELPECANAALLITACVVLFDSSHLPNDPDSKSSLNMTGAGGGGDAETVMPALPVLPSLEAVIVAVPFATAVTKPDVETVAIPMLLELHVMTRPVSTLVFASLVTADS